MSCGSMTTLSQHHHQLLTKNNSPTSHSCYSFPFTPATGSCIELYWFMNACASTGSGIGEAEVVVWGWKWLWHCHPKLNSSAFKIYMRLLFFPLTLTSRPTVLTLPAKMVHSMLLPSPMASSLGWASQHFFFDTAFPFDPAAHERGCCVATQVPNLALLNNQRGKKPMRLRSWELHWELYLLHMFRWTNEGLKAFATKQALHHQTPECLFSHISFLPQVFLCDITMHTRTILFHCARFLM